MDALEQVGVGVHAPLGGWLFVALGLTLAVAAVLLSGAIVSTLGLVVYSYLVWRSDADKVPPAGTWPADEEPRD